MILVVFQTKWTSWGGLGAIRNNLGGLQAHGDKRRAMDDSFPTVSEVVNPEPLAGRQREHTPAWRCQAWPTSQAFASPRHPAPAEHTVICVV